MSSEPEILNYQVNRKANYSISEKFNLDVNLYKGITIKKIFFIMCISLVFIVGLFVFKPADENNIDSVNGKNKNISQIINGGVNSLKSWGNDTFCSFGLYNDSVHYNQKDSCGKDFMKNLSMNSYSIDPSKNHFRK